MRRPLEALARLAAEAEDIQPPLLADCLQEWRQLPDALLAIPLAIASFCRKRPPPLRQRLVLCASLFGGQLRTAPPAGRRTAWPGQ